MLTEWIYYTFARDISDVCSYQMAGIIDFLAY